MPLNPPLRDAPRFPVSSLVAIACIAASLRYWFLHSLSGLAPASGSVLTEPWTLFTSIFPHGDVVHLFFNLYWWWYFAPRLERALGSAKLIGIVLLLAIVSSGAEYALLRGGIGLSGVVYGFCTLIWVIQNRYDVLRGTVPRQTLQLFAAWFVICIILTLTGTLPVGNIAHGAGALCGWLLGKSIIAAPTRRLAWLGALGASVIFAVVGSTVGRTWVSLYRLSSSHTYAAYFAQADGRFDDAIRHLEAARSEDPNNAETLVGLGSAYARKGRHAEALAAYKQALELAPKNRAELAPYIAWLLDLQSAAAAKRGDASAVRKLADESLRWKPGGEYATKMLEWAKSRSSPLNDIIHPSTSTLSPGDAPHSLNSVP